MTGSDVEALLMERGFENISVKTIKGNRGQTDFIKIRIPGTEGKLNGGESPTIGVIERLGGIEARPEIVGIVSDADGAVTTLSIALKLADMRSNRDPLKGDVVVGTHICPNAPVAPHRPVPFMGSPVGSGVMNREEVDGAWTPSFL